MLRSLPMDSNPRRFATTHKAGSGSARCTFSAPTPHAQVRMDLWLLLPCPRFVMAVLRRYLCLEGRGEVAGNLRTYRGRLHGTVSISMGDLVINASHLEQGKAWLLGVCDAAGVDAGEVVPFAGA